MAHVIDAWTVKLNGLPSTIREKTKRLELKRGTLWSDGDSTKNSLFCNRSFQPAIHTHTPEERAHFSRSQAIAKYLERKTAVSPGSATTYGTHIRAFAQYIYRKHSKVDVDAFIEKLKRNIDLYDELAGFASFFEGGAKGRVLSGNILQNIKFEEYSLIEVSQVEIDDEMYSGGDEIPSSS
jgi:hypothetical protein